MPRRPATVAMVPSASPPGDRRPMPALVVRRPAPERVRWRPQPPGGTERAAAQPPRGGVLGPKGWRGIDPLRDITWLQIGSTLERLAAMQHKNIQGRAR